MVTAVATVVACRSVSFRAIGDFESIVDRFIPFKAEEGFSLRGVGASPPDGSAGEGGRSQLT